MKVNNKKGRREFSKEKRIRPTFPMFVDNDIVARTRKNRRDLVTDVGYSISLH